MIRTNKDRLPMVAVQGNAAHPVDVDLIMISSDANGFGHATPQLAGLTYNVQIGDPCMEMVGEHVEASVSSKREGNPFEHAAYLAFPGLGNEVRVVTGRAAGNIGKVTGKHGGSHLMIQFSESTMEKLTYQDQLLVKAFGRGLKLLDYPDIAVMNLDPAVLERMVIEEKDGAIVVPVAKRIPSCVMGSGVGQTPYTGDYDLMTSDRELMHKLGLDDLRYGDIVALEDADNTFGRGYLKGAISIGVVIHGDSFTMGHGPGITTLLSCKTAKIKTVLDPNANLKNYI